MDEGTGLSFWINQDCKNVQQPLNNWILSADINGIYLDKIKIWITLILNYIFIKYIYL
jgi:hypothetical protein